MTIPASFLAKRAYFSASGFVASFCHCMGFLPIMFELLALVLVFLYLQSGRTRLARRVDGLEAEIGALRQALANRDMSKPAEEVPSAAAVSEKIVWEQEGPADRPVPAEDMASPPPETTAAATASDPLPDQTPSLPPPPVSPVLPPRSGLSLEGLLGGHWAVWVGGVALALGGVLMARYAIESGLLSPGFRLSLACLFGLAIIGAAEFIRRKGVPAGIVSLSGPVSQNAMIPGILTAAGGVTLFSSIYAAHQIYGFIGPSFTFLALAIVALAILGLSLLHGQALAGLALLGALATPALVQQSADPNIAVLMTYVGVVWLGALAASRLMGWIQVPILATLGAGCWAILATLASLSNAPTVLLLFQIGMTLLLTPDIPLFGIPTSGPGAVSVRNRRAGAQALWGVLALTSMGSALISLNPPVFIAAGHLPFAFLLLLAALMLAAARRRDALAAAVLGILAGLSGVGGIFIAYDQMMRLVPADGGVDHRTLIPVLVGIIALGSAALALFSRRQAGRIRETIWSLIAISPILLCALSYAHHGNWHRDIAHALLSLLFAGLLVAMTEVLNRFRPAGLARLVENTLVTGFYGGLALSLFMLADPLSLMVLWPLSGLACLLAYRLRPWRALPWMMVVSAGLVFARIAYDPTIVGAEQLGTTPVFNALLVGYGLPALLLAAAAFLSRRLDDGRLTRVLDGLAVLMGFLAVAVLVRHGMNHGRLDGGQPSLGEQSIYTLLVIGLSGMMMVLDRRNANPVFVFGSMLAGGLSMLMVLASHLLQLNPYLTGELVGDWPLLNLLLPAYLLPGLAYGGLALMARERRPRPYVLALGLAGAVLGFSWITLSVRQAWQGTSLADWQGFMAGETYTYSAVWLLTGVALLALGARFRSLGLRYASAAVVILTVIKVFLFDLSNLEGLLRAVSFIGLGFVLIGIGLFYQKILSRDGSPPREA